MSDQPAEVRIGGQRIHDGKLKFDVDQVRLTSGVEARREVVRHPGAVVIVPLRDDGCVVLVRQYRYAAGEWLLELPAGTLDHDGEDPETAARRELLEETGHTAETLEPIVSFFSAPGFCDELLHVFVARGARQAGEARPEDDETVSTVIMPLSAARTLALRGELRDVKTIAGLLCVPVDPPAPPTSVA